MERDDHLSLDKQALLALRRMRAKIVELERSKTEPIAVIGIGCRFPGGATDPDSYWKLLREGIDAISVVPQDRWNIDTYYDPDPDAPGKMSTRWGGFLKQVDCFDPQFFGITPREAETMDPQQRLLLEVTWEALENAGLAPDRLSGTQTGVFVGICSTDYLQHYVKHIDPKHIDAYFGSGASHAIASGRLSYFLDLQGPCFSVDTACSSSLVAVHQGCQSLLAGECRMALAGGVNVILTPEGTINLSKCKMMAANGRCKTFDAAADGFVRGEGCGMVVLKRLSDALADRDNIMALVRGTATNQDGRSSGLTAPNELAQEAVIRQALARARIEPRQVGFVEAHGTGTSLGDPIEVQALGAVLGNGRPKNQSLRIGSVKTNIGHLEAAAGIAGFIKVVLTLQHREIPPHLHLQEFNPHVAWDKLPIEIPTKLTSWLSGELPRFAGVSSFGFSGTNAHAVLEEAPIPETAKAEIDRPLHILTLSAKSEMGLMQLVERYDRHLEEHSDTPLADVCFTVNFGRAHFDHRVAVVAESLEQMRGELAAWASGKQTAGAQSGQVRELVGPDVVFLFSGQGDSYEGMGRELYETQPTFRAALQRCNEILVPYLDRPLLTAVYPANGATAVMEGTVYDPLATFALEYSLAELWKAWGVEPAVVMGHGVGEFVAACVAGVFSLEDGLKLVMEFARLLRAQAGASEAAEVSASEARTLAAVVPYQDVVSIASVNGPDNVVISGSQEAVRAICRDLQGEGIRTLTLGSSHISRPSLTAQNLHAFESVANQVEYAPPRIALISTLTGETARGDVVTTSGYWSRHIHEPVRFFRGMKTLCEKDKNLFVEIGPGSTLLEMGKRAFTRSMSGVWLPSLRRGRHDWQQILDCLASLYVRGVKVNWSGFDRDYVRRRTVLPTYPFQRKRCWIELKDHGRQESKTRIRDQIVHPLLGHRVRSPGLDDIVYQSRICLDTALFLRDHRIQDAVVLPEVAYLEMAIAAARDGLGMTEVALEEISFRKPLEIQDGDARIVQVILTLESPAMASFHVYSLDKVDGESEDKWTVHATGKVCTMHFDAGAASKRTISLSQVRRTCQEKVILAAYYQGARKYGVRLGKQFRGLVRAWKSDDKALGQIRLPKELELEASDYCLHPSLLHATIQILGTALVGNVTQSTASERYLPAGFDRFRVYDHVPKQLWAYGLLRPRDEHQNEIRVGDILLMDNVGHLVAEVSGVSLKRMRRSQGQRSRQKNVNELMYEVQWQSKSREESAPPIEKPSSWIILADEAGVGRKLAESLRMRNQRCVLVSAGSAFHALDEDHFEIDPARPDEFQRLRDALHPNQPPLRGVVHMWSLDSENAEQCTSDQLAEAQVRGCGSVLHLVQALVRNEVPERIRFWLLTRGAQPVGSVSRALCVTQAPVWGLGGVIAREHPELGCVRVDLDPSKNNDDISSVLDEIWLGDLENQIAFRGGVRYVARLVRRDAELDLVDRFRVARQQVDAPQVSIRSDGTYLITGGLSGLGLLVARWLVRKGARHLVLMGRNRPSQVAQDAIIEFEDKGVQVVVIQADVSQRADVEKMLAKIAESMPPLRGVIHSAGVLDDGVLLQQAWPRFLKVMAPKVSGAWNLHTMTKRLPLDFFVLFSSAASLLGSPGQGNHAAANSFLDALGHHRRAHGLPAVSINWGPWSEVGAAARRIVGQSIATRGMDFIAPPRGLRALEEVLRRDFTQVAVMAVQWPSIMQQFGSEFLSPFLSELAPKAAFQGLEQDPQLAERLRLVRQWNCVLPAERQRLVQEYLCKQAAGIMGLSTAGLDMKKPLAMQGLDSLMAVQLKNQLQIVLGASPPVDKFLDGHAAESLAEWLVDVLEQRSFSKEIPSTRPTRAAQSLTNLDQFSDDEVDRLLREMSAEESV